MNDVDWVWNTHDRNYLIREPLAGRLGILQ
jgi:hypothetical protein